MASGRVDPASRAVIAELLTTDADLRAVARDLVLSGLTELVNLQKRGDPAIKARLALALAGPIVAAITEPVEEDEFGGLRAEFVEMMEEVRGAIMPERREFSAADTEELAAAPTALVPKSL